MSLSDRGDTRADTYSRGMLQRLGIADALIKEPEILILDEPTAAIDPIGVVEILQLLRDLVRERGVTVLLSSHLLTQVQSVCDRVGIFAAGRLIGLGTVPELADTVRQRHRARRGHLRGRAGGRRRRPHRADPVGDPAGREGRARRRQPRAVDAHRSTGRAPGARCGRRCWPPRPASRWG